MAVGDARRGDPEGARRAELLDELLRYSAEHGLSEVSLRPLAAAVGSSPRVLLYFFGSKDGLVREVHRHARREQVRVIDQALAEDAEPAAAVRALWEWLADPAHHNIEKFFFEGFARSLHATDGPWHGFAATSVAEWLPRLISALEGSSANPTLILAALRGLLLDLLATGDHERVSAAADELIRSI
ncbi:TetR/AcrR family transcriptional regulator [Haloechinothrix sp. LS1_15]|uniref:TetR/AcrR family transcriptional regulator n=1 Tax=Haloechinothrix sp. LS1_15 TaxID=2652248 RepID=UPI002947EB96|nr:TetR/AcrR family transcriptional regulator [Haloechinothrix sp. LS1_15]MDV6014345.1 TetR/AcrR family transcriptional regulator [Haloechinothrix sp. LS1_15]